MKIAVLICGETRTWDATDVEKNYKIPGKYPCVSEGWKNLKKQTANLPDVTIDFYGITWKHCTPPADPTLFKNIKYVDFHGTEYRSELMKEGQIVFNNMGTPQGSDSEYYWNTVAQYYQWISGLKFVYQHDNYNFVLKSRWDVAPNDNIPDTLFRQIKYIENSYKIPFLGVEQMAVIQQSGRQKITFLDINFVINQHLYNSQFKKNSTDYILLQHISSNPPSGIGNHDLFFPSDQESADKMTGCIIDSGVFTRINHLGYCDYSFMEDYKKNLSSTPRPPT